MPRQQNKNGFKKIFKHGRDFRKVHKKSNSDNSKFNSSKANKFKHIQRNKEAEEVLKKQREIELGYQKMGKIVNIDDIDSEPEEDVFNQLLSTFKQKQGVKRSVESSTDESDNNGELSENEDQEFDEEKFTIERKEGITTPQNDESSDSGSEDSDDEQVCDDSEKLDPFCLHLNHDLSPGLLNAVTSKPRNTIKHEIKTEILGRLEINIPSDKNNSDPTSNIKKIKPMILDEEQQYAQMGSIPKILNYKNLDLKDHHVKSQIDRNVASANKSNLENSNGQTLTQLQAELFSLMNNYQDVYFPNRNINNGEQIRFTYCLHASNHVLKTRLKIIHHNSRLGKLKYQNGDDCTPDHCRDQGLVRPKVLIILPFRDSAYRVITTLIELLVPDLGVGVINYKKFVDEFSGNSIKFPIKNPKPEDYEKTFAGNIDDTFRIGISLTKKCLKLYTEFSKSDIIISSPLGLRMIIGAPGEKDRDYDFLSSIELLIMDQTEIFLAQNWDHLLHILNHVHLQPQTIETDLSRVRTWSINGLSKFYCQTILLTSHELPEFRALYNHRCLNYRGQIRITNSITSGSIKNIVIQLPQIFHRINSSSLESSFDLRFNHFINNVLPQYKNPSMAHSLIYIPSYFDYVRIRNYMKHETINFVQICEYSKDEKIARARDMFFHSSAHFLVYSERAHFYRRTRIKGIRHLIFYQPPNWPNFYAEMINLMQEMNQNKRDGASDSMTVTVLYTKYDILQISEIVGHEKASKMMNSDKTTHLFMTGN